MRKLLLALLVILSSCSEKKCVDGNLYELIGDIWVSLDDAKCVNIGATYPGKIKRESHKEYLTRLLNGCSEILLEKTIENHEHQK